MQEGEVKEELCGGGAGEGLGEGEEFLVLWGWGSDIYILYGEEMRGFRVLCSCAGVGVR